MDLRPAYGPGPRRPCGGLCHNGTNVVIARISPEVGSRRHVKSGGQGKLRRESLRYLWVSVASDSDNPLIQRRILANCGRPSTVWEVGLLKRAQTE